MSAQVIRTAIVLLMFAVAGASVAAKQLAPAPAQPRPQPGVDPLTASIQGRITTDTGVPIRRAEIRAVAQTGVTRLATTDTEGRFNLRDLPAGSYRLAASKSGFLSLNYGQRRPFDASRTIDLKQGQSVTVTFPLPRGGAISGRVYDEAGEPLADVRVQALRARTIEGKRRLEPAGTADTTDDTGAYRIYGLGPADYFVSATPPRLGPAAMQGAAAGTDIHASATRKLMAMFYPGTPALEEAQRVALDAGGEARADIQLGPGRSVIVSGIVMNSSGAPVVNMAVTLRPEAMTMAAAMSGGGPPLLIVTTISGHTGADGTFTIPDVPPGSYTLTVMGSPMTGGSPFDSVPETATVPVVVAGADMAGLTVVTTTAAAVEGTVVADVGVRQPLPPGIEVRIASPSTSAAHLMMSGNGNQFRVMGMGDPTYLTIPGLPDGWAIKAIMIDGQNMIDKPLKGRATGVRVVLTDRVTELSGVIAAAAATDESRSHSVVVFSEDASKWTFPSRFVRTVRSDDAGSFRISGLPGDERYLAIAVDYLEDGESGDPDFLERMRDRATSVTLNEADRKNVELRLIKR